MIRVELPAVAMLILPLLPRKRGNYHNAGVIVGWVLHSLLHIALHIFLSLSVYASFLVLSFHSCTKLPPTPEISDKRNGGEMLRDTCSRATPFGITILAPTFFLHTWGHRMLITFSFYTNPSTPPHIARRLYRFFAMTPGMDCPDMRIGFSCIPRVSTLPQIPFSHDLCLYFLVFHSETH